MNIRILTITGSKGTPHKNPGISFHSKSLYGLGFVPGALVSVVPSPGGGLVFTLCDENIRRYSELHATTLEQGGKLIQIKTTCRKCKKKYPSIGVFGQIFYDAGFAIGDPVIVQCEYGVVRVNKRFGTAMPVHMTQRRDRRTGYAAPNLRVAGEWLADFGFSPGAVMTVSIESGSVILKLCEDGIEKYADLVRYARQNKMKIARVKSAYVKGKPYSFIEMSGLYMARAGFETGETLFAYPEMGLIKLQKPEASDLGF